MGYYTNFENTEEVPNNWGNAIAQLQKSGYRPDSPDEIKRKLEEQERKEALQGLAVGVGGTALALAAPEAIPWLARMGAPARAALAAVENPVSQHYIKNTAGRLIVQHALPLATYMAGEEVYKHSKTGYDGRRYNTLTDRFMSNFPPNMYNDEEEEYWKNQLSNGNHHTPVSPGLINLGGMFTIPHPAGMYAGEGLNEIMSGYNHIKNQFNPQPVITP